MTGESWEPKPMGKDFATTEEVSEVARVNRASLYEWVREGLLPAPKTTGGRGVMVANFVRTQRELGFGLSEIRLRIIEAFGERILEVIAEPRGPRARARGGKKLAKRRAKN